MSDNPVPIKHYSTDQFVHEVFAEQMKHDDTVELFYRGHSDSTFLLKPSLFRDQGHLDNEERLFRELQVLNPADFGTDATTLDKLVRMQHYSLPTRLLDITSNPLVALYFACGIEDATTRSKDGEVVVLAIDREWIKFYDSDTASCLANLVRLTSGEKKQISLKRGRAKKPLTTGNLNRGWPMGRLLHFIKDEKPYFLPKIHPEDLFGVACVKTKFNNSRIAYQVGASILFGLDATLSETGTDKISIKRIKIPAVDKKILLKQLDTLNIKTSTVFPYVENSARLLSTKYRDGVTPPMS